MNDKGKVRTALVYATMVTFVGSFVFAAMQAQLPRAADQNSVIPSTGEERTDERIESGMEGLRGEERDQEEDEDGTSASSGREQTSERIEDGLEGLKDPGERDVEAGNKTQDERQNEDARFADVRSDYFFDEPSTSCSEENSGRACAAFVVQPGEVNQWIWYLAADFENIEGQELVVRKNSAEITALVVFYKNGERENISFEEFGLRLKGNGAIEAIFVQGGASEESEAQGSFEIQIQ